MGSVWVSALWGGFSLILVALRGFCVLLGTSLVRAHASFWYVGWFSFWLIVWPLYMIILRFCPKSALVFVLHAGARPSLVGGIRA